MSSGNWTNYVFFAGDRIARREYPAGDVFYYFSDHLNTTSVVRDSAGGQRAESDYYPWGGELQFVNNDTNHYKFTGKERDTETQLDYFGARYYSNGLGRFVTPDWAAKATAVPYAEFADPQSLNLYSYVRNIPTTRYDVDGHEPGDNDNKKSAPAPTSSPTPAQQPAQQPKEHTMWYYMFHTNTSGTDHNPSGVTCDDACYNSWMAFHEVTSLVGGVYAATAVGTGKEPQLAVNKANGKAFEQAVVDTTKATDTSVVEQVTVKTQSGLKTRIDVVSTTPSGQTRLQEAKASATAPVNPNQAAAHVEIGQTGATVAGQGKPGYPGGTQIPPTKVEVVRPQQ